MANTFKSYGSSGVGTSFVDVYTAPASTTATVIGLSVANTSAGIVTVDVAVTKGATDYYLVKGASIPVGGALVVVGADQKAVLETGNKIKVKSSVAASVDGFISVLEIS